jgi:peptide/nickel transport system substrate-binding protein
VEALVARARATRDAAAAGAAWSRVDRLLVDEAPAIPLYTVSRADLVSKRVGNYIYNPEFGVLLDQLWVK